jgi:hypothetical protein
MTKVEPAAQRHRERSLYAGAVKDLQRGNRSIREATILELEILRWAEYGCAQDDMIARWGAWTLDIGHLRARHSRSASLVVPC